MFYKKTYFFYNVNVDSIYIHKKTALKAVFKSFK